MRRKDRELNERAEILELLDTAQVVHLGLIDGNRPYVVPLHYGYTYEDGVLTLYMHGAREGRKKEVIEKNENAFIEIDADMEIVSGDDIACKYGAKYKSLMADAKVSLVEGEEKIHGLKVLMKTQTGREFEITDKMAESVTVIKAVASEITAKARK